MRTTSLIATSVTLLSAVFAPLAAQRADTTTRANVRGILEAIDRNDAGLWSDGRDDDRERSRVVIGRNQDSWGDRDDRRSRAERDRELARWRRDRERAVKACERDLWRRVHDEDRWDRRERDNRSVKERIHRYCERRVWERNPRISDRYNW